MALEWLKKMRKKKAEVNKTPAAAQTVNPVAQQKPEPKASAKKKERRASEKPAKQLKSARTAGRGVERADGRWCTPFELRLMAARGCNLDIAFAGKLKDL